MQITLINQNPQHNKYWTATQNQNTLTIKWGRIGTAGSSQTKQFKSEHEAKHHLNKKINEKLNKNYNHTTQANLDKLHIIATTIGTSNKLTNIQWVEILNHTQNTIHTKHLKNEQLLDPNISPNIITTIETHQTTHQLLITPEETYIITPNIWNSHTGTNHYNIQPLTKDHELHKLHTKIQEAIGHSI